MVSRAPGTAARRRRVALATDSSEAAVGGRWASLVASRGYVPQHLTRDAFVRFLHRASEIGGLLLDGELEGTGDVIRAEAEQLIGRDEAIDALSA